MISCNRHFKLVSLPFRKELIWFYVISNIYALHAGGLNFYFGWHLEQCELHLITHTVLVFFLSHEHIWYRSSKLLIESIWETLYFRLYSSILQSNCIKNNNYTHSSLVRKHRNSVLRLAFQYWRRMKKRNEKNTWALCNCHAVSIDSLDWQYAILYAMKNAA